jgi:hypothetical protein
MDDATYEIGRLEPWADDPMTFDGWLEESDGPIDELVVNGASEVWATYRVLRRYLETLLVEVDKTGGRLRPVERLNATGVLGRLAAVAEEMEHALLEHLRED